MNQAPRSLKIVAALFVLSGVLSALGVLVSLAHGHVRLNLGVLCIFVGYGLLRLRPGWRTWALVFTWITLLVAPVLVLLVLFGHCPAYFSVFGQRVGSAPPELAAVAGVCFFAFGVWQYRVLTRPDVVRLFHESST